MSKSMKVDENLHGLLLALKISYGDPSMSATVRRLASRLSQIEKARLREAIVQKLFSEEEVK